NAIPLNTLHNLFIEQFQSCNVKAESIFSQLEAYYSSYYNVKRDWQELSTTISNLWNLTLLESTEARNDQILGITRELKEICQFQLIDVNFYCKDLSFVNNLLPFSYTSYGDNIVEMDPQSWVKLEFALRRAED